MNSSTTDKNTLKDHNRSTAYDHIKMSSAVSKMDDATRNLIHRLRQKRNSRVHARYEVNESKVAIVYLLQINSLSFIKKIAG
jgi:hypothetical protein